MESIPIYGIHKVKMLYQCVIPACGAVGLLIAPYGPEKETESVFPAHGAVDLLAAPYRAERMTVSVIPANGPVDLLSVPYQMEGKTESVIPVQTGIPERGRANRWNPLDSRVRGNDDKACSVFRILS